MGDDESGIDMWKHLSWVWKALVVLVPIVAALAGWLGAVNVGPGQRVAVIEARQVTMDARQEKLERYLLLLVIKTCVEKDSSAAMTNTPLAFRLERICSEALSEERLP